MFSRRVDLPVACVFLPFGQSVVSHSWCQGDPRGRCARHHCLLVLLHRHMGKHKGHLCLLSWRILRLGSQKRWSAKTSYSEWNGWRWLFMSKKTSLNHLHSRPPTNLIRKLMKNSDQVIICELIYIYILFSNCWDILFWIETHPTLQIVSPICP